MIDYDEKVKQLFCKNDFVGELDINEPNVSFGRAGNFSVGDVVEFYIRVNDEKKIIDIKFKAHGSCATIAAANYVAAEILNRHLDDIKKITWQSICEALHLPEVRRHSALLVLDAVSDSAAKAIIT